MFIDIACNITEKLFKPEKIDNIIKNCISSNTIPIFVGLDYESSIEALKYAEKYKTYSYAGIHPLHSQNAKNIEEIFLTNNKRIIGIGECGLDYYRLQYSDKITQKNIFINQLDLNGDRYFLHSRNCHRDFIEIVSDYQIKGVVHSFTGAIEESNELIKKGFFIGINGCSLKDENGIEVVKSLPLENILIETDSPYCQLRKSYAGYKYCKNYDSKNKINEPSNVFQIAECISMIKNVDTDELKIVLENNSRMFFGDDFKTDEFFNQDIKDRDLIK